MAYHAEARGSEFRQQDQFYAGCSRYVVHTYGAGEHTFKIPALRPMVSAARNARNPGATISSVAIHHDVNANVIHKWLPIYWDQPVAALPAFVPVKPAPRRATKEMQGYGEEWQRCLAVKSTVRIGQKTCD